MPSLLPLASLLLLSVSAFSELQIVSSSPLCPHESAVFRNNLESQCSLSISPNPPLEVDGDFLNRVLTSEQRNGYTVVLFYASWCPFSRIVLPTYEILSMMFPQVQHLSVEQSSAIPSVFSIYGIHSVPSILIVNETSKMRYRGPKSLQSIVQFYQKITGLEPVQFIAENQPINSGVEKSIMQLWKGSSLMKISTGEPYLLCSILFLCLRVLSSIFPKVLSHLKAFWISYIPHFNLGIFGETSQIMGRVLHMIDVRRIWTKLRLCKARNFHEGAKNARVWASSLASVSLGESSSARSS